MAGRKMTSAEFVADPDNLIRLESWARDGFTDKEIAKEIGIAENTFVRWKKSEPVMVEALKKGRRPIDFEVENALLKRALGYDYEEITTITKSDGSVEQRITKKTLAPDTTAQIFWLKNRKPFFWRDRRLELLDPEKDAKKINDNFIEALNSTAADDWSGDDDS